MQNYSTIIGVIELRQNGIGYRTIRRRYVVGNSVITLIMDRFKELGITLDELRIMNPRDVEAKFYPEENRRDTSKPRPDFFVIHEMMTKMKHPDLAFIWMDYYKPKHEHKSRRGRVRAASGGWTDRERASREITPLIQRSRSSFPSTPVTSISPESIRSFFDDSMDWF